MVRARLLTELQLRRYESAVVAALLQNADRDREGRLPDQYVEVTKRPRGNPPVHLLGKRRPLQRKSVDPGPAQHVQYFDQRGGKKKTSARHDPRSRGQGFRDLDRHQNSSRKGVAVQQRDQSVGVGVVDHARPFRTSRDCARRSFDMRLAHLPARAREQDFNLWTPGILSPGAHRSNPPPQGVVKKSAIFVQAHLRHRQGVPVRNDGMPAPQPSPRWPRWRRRAHRIDSSRTIGTQCALHVVIRCHQDDA